MSGTDPNPEILEALRLLHERVERIETLHENSLRFPSLPTKWNPFSGASSEELQRIASLEQTDDQIKRAMFLHDALYSSLFEQVNELRARVGLPPSHPLPYAPRPNMQPQPNTWPQPSAPYVHPQPQPQPQPAAAARMHALHAKYRRFIQEADRLGKTL